MASDISWDASSSSPVEGSLSSSVVSSSISLDDVLSNKYFKRTGYFKNITGGGGGPLVQNQVYDVSFFLTTHCVMHMFLNQFHSLVDRLYLALT